MKKLALIFFFSIALLISTVPSLAAQAPRAGASCPKAGMTTTFQGKKFTCLKKGKKLAWGKGVAIKSSSEVAGKPSRTVKKVTYQPPSISGDDVEKCRVKEVSNARGMTGAGFPVWNSLTPKNGTVKWALIPIDFQDLPGESNFRVRVDEQMKLLADWYSTVSEGKFKIEWIVQNNWVRLPRPSTEYKIQNSNNLDREPNGIKLWKDAMTSADPIFNFAGVQTVNFILPKGQTFLNETSQGFPWDKDVKEMITNEGAVSSFSIPGRFFDQPGRQYWSYWAHEFGHAIGLPHIGVSRGEPSLFHPLDLMGNQDAISRELSGWLRFIAAWLPDEKVFCKEFTNPLPQVSSNESLTDLSGKNCSKENEVIRNSFGEFWCINTQNQLRWSKNNVSTPSGAGSSPGQTALPSSTSTWNEIEITLVPLSRPDKGVKFVVIPVSATKAVLVESRRVTKFSCGPSNRNGVLVYTYDATLGHGENFLTPAIPTGRVATSIAPPCQASPFPDPLLYEGDRVTIEGVSVQLLESGTLDRIKISRG
jgi:M6 family metalloprotease-like protein